MREPVPKPEKTPERLPWAEAASSNEAERRGGGGPQPSA